MPSWEVRQLNSCQQLPVTQCLAPHLSSEYVDRTGDLCRAWTEAQNCMIPKLCSLTCSALQACGYNDAPVLDCVRYLERDGEGVQRSLGTFQPKNFRSSCTCRHMSARMPCWL